MVDVVAAIPAVPRCCAVSFNRRAGLQGLLALALAPIAAQAARRSGAPALLLAEEAPEDVDPQGYLVSEKYDGVRAVWDGQVLRSRSGRIHPAPAWFTARLPSTPLDGELWMDRGRFEDLSAAVRRQQADDAEWRQIRYMVFELPGGAGTFAQRAGGFQALARVAAWPQLQAVVQQPVVDRAELQRRLDAVVAAGGEGLALHRADAPYLTGRSAALLKLKPLSDAEAVVIAHAPGQGKHAGRLGALQVRTPAGLVFHIGTGLSDAQRESPPAVGTVITYTYRGLTSGGLPRFASFLRVRPAEAG